MRVTGYSRLEHSSHTYDGTPITTDERIAAASWNIPLGWYVDVDGLGASRRRPWGRRADGWVDIATLVESKKPMH